MSFYQTKTLGWLIIAEGGLLLSQERTYKRKEKTKTMGASLEKKER